MYTGSGWQSSPTVEVSYQPGQEISSISSESFEIVTQEFRLSNAVRGTLYSAGEPVTLDHEALVSWRTIVEEGNNGDSQIVGMADTFGVTMDALLYQVRSLVSNASDEDLRHAEEILPTWISERYLALPDSIPERVITLAEEVVANQPTRYDQAKAIEAYLRTYPYTLNLEAPPADRDVADYFLFELQTGYCDYYATSMVVLARAVGVPARVVVGYVGGQYDQENDNYQVTEADAHTWVEVYFSGFGWVPFEPTAALNLIDDQDPILPLPPELATLPQIAEAEEEGVFPWWRIGLGSLVMLILFIWIRARVDLARLGRMDPSRLALTIYSRMYRYGRWMRIGHLRSDTLYEFNSKIAEAFEEIEAKRPRSKRWQGVYSELNQLTDYAIQANYSLVTLEKDLNKEIIQVWRSLRAKLRSAVWIKFWMAQGERLKFWDQSTDGLELIGDGAADGTR
jgi:transglutaminase-like putative cysteine protease